MTRTLPLFSKIVAIGMASAMVTACGRTQHDEQAQSEDGLKIMQQATTPAVTQSTDDAPPAVRVLSPQELAEQDQTADDLKTCVAKNLGVASGKVEIIKKPQVESTDTVKIPAGMVTNVYVEKPDGTYGFAFNKTVDSTFEVQGSKISPEPVTNADYVKNAEDAGKLARSLSVCFKNFKGFTYG